MMRAMPPCPGLYLLAIVGACVALQPAAAQAQSRWKVDEPVVVSPDATAPAPAQKLANRGRSFVPLHSTLVGQGGVTRLNFSGALSIHNASASNVLAVERIDYRSGSGELVEAYVAEPIYLKPYGSLQVVIAKDDVRGGTGASFTVDWSTPDGSDEPVVEAVMASTIGTNSFSFLSTGRRVSRPQ